MGLTFTFTRLRVHEQTKFAVCQKENDNTAQFEDVMNELLAETHIRQNTLALSDQNYQAKRRKLSGIL